MLLSTDSSIFISHRDKVMDPPSVHAFLVKLWLERRERADAQPEWRGRIDHIQSGKRVYFRDLAGITRFIQAFLECADSLFSEAERNRAEPDLEATRHPSTLPDSDLPEPNPETLSRDQKSDQTPEGIDLGES